MTLIGGAAASETPIGDMSLKQPRENTGLLDQDLTTHYHFVSCGWLPYMVVSDTTAGIDHDREKDGHSMRLLGYFLQRDLRNTAPWDEPLIRNICNRF